MKLCTNNNISIRKMCDSNEDKLLLLKWLSTPEVLKLVYSEDTPWDIKKIEEKFRGKICGTENATACFIEYEDKAVGYIQYYSVEIDSYAFNEHVPYETVADGYGMDIFIGYPELWGRGIGSDAVCMMKDYLINELNAKVVCADPEENNHRSVRCWLKCGFKAVGKIQNYDNPEKISILMVAKN